MSTLAELHRVGELTGYNLGTPGRNQNSLIDAADIDQEIAEADPCPTCGGKMEYTPFTRRDAQGVSYRAFAVCAKCGETLEF